MVYIIVFVVCVKYIKVEKSFVDPSRSCEIMFVQLVVLCCTLCCAVRCVVLYVVLCCMLCCDMLCCDVSCCVVL